MAACLSIYPCQLYRANDNVGYLIGSQHVEQLDVFCMTGPSSSRYSPFVERETQIRIVRSVLPSPIFSTSYGPANPQSTCTSTSYRERRVYCFLVHVGEETVRSLMPIDPTPGPERRARQEFSDDQKTTWRRPRRGIGSILHTHTYSERAAWHDHQAVPRPTDPAKRTNGVG